MRKLLYACQSRADRIVAYDTDGKAELITDGITAPERHRDQQPTAEFMSLNRQSIRSGFI